jgi:hypothetical protein
MSQNTFWNTISQPQPYNFPIWAVLESHSIYTVELLREPSALNWTKIKAWMPAQVPEAPLERWEQLAYEYYQRKIESNNSILGTKEWFLEGVKYGKDQQYFDQKWNTVKDNSDGNTPLSTLNNTSPLSGIIYNASEWEKWQKSINAIDKSFWNVDKNYPIDNTNSKQNACTTDEFKAKYGQYGENYKPQTDPNTPWNPKWDNL